MKIDFTENFLTNFSDQQLLNIYQIQANNSFIIYCDLVIIRNWK